MKDGLPSLPLARVNAVSLYSIWRLFDHVQFLGSWMVVFRLRSMSRTVREDCPQPPSVEEIVSDLRSAKASDVAFKPPESFPALMNSQENTRLLNAAAGSLREENLQKQAVSKQYEDDAEVASESAEHHAVVYDKVQEFLEHYEVLATSVGKLKGFDSDLKSKESSLTQSIKQVKELWKVDKTES